MSAPSKWPLPENGTRFLTPAFMLNKLARHPPYPGVLSHGHGFLSHGPLTPHAAQPPR